jgi:hypothetical protein
MAAKQQAKGRVAVSRGVFPEGTRVRLLEMESDRVLRPEVGDPVVASAVADQLGRVSFEGSEVKPGGHYFAVGMVDGTPVQARCRAKAA